ncbi:HET-domain-containing protein [Leucogyrophana mollusca]|uniref:HET-domain-containing protein n=1 Tax=Leucogyrophana mollusca TaxID=85980 RepID=A0ACB8BEV7_9AGAM|nr:HET-domain-containing protein [Leucogyrophana mollusca]
MRLLNTRTLKLEEPRGHPKYAILSHVWSDEEVTFRDISEPHAANLAEYSKIEHGCAQALEDGYDYIWVDTCCIDKSSSAELSEAINSMHRWYEEAVVCYAYLRDVPSEEDPAAQYSKFRQSVWFQRGWTLQEAIAPWRIDFFARDWVKIGTKESLSSVISAVTGVDERVLLKITPLSEVSVARKMSWASQRQTTRVEDRAYSLMGIFGVHMPLIYGEGRNAFIRLQHEIMRTSNDQSIFAWGIWSTTTTMSSLLASSPRCFQKSALVDRISSIDFARQFPAAFNDTDCKPHFSTDNRGIRISLPVKITPSGYTAALACSNNGRLVGIDLRVSCEDGICYKIRTGDLSDFSWPDGEFVVRDLVLSTTPNFDVGVFPSPAFVPVGLPPVSKRICVQTVRVNEAGFVLRKYRHSLGQELYARAGGLAWDTTLFEAKCVLAYQNWTSGEGFVVTIAQWERMQDFFSSGFLGPYCCLSHPNWAFKPLRSGGRVTVTCPRHAFPNSPDVTILVDRPQSAKARRRNARLIQNHA